MTFGPVARRAGAEELPSASCGGLSLAGGRVVSGEGPHPGGDGEVTVPRRFWVRLAAGVALVAAGMLSVGVLEATGEQGSLLNDWLIGVLVLAVLAGLLALQAARAPRPDRRP